MNNECKQHLPAKVTLPRIKNCFRRRRVFRLLDRYRNKPIIWISGPAGSGKTVLTSSYLEYREIKYLWYQVDGRDNDPTSFFYYLNLSFNSYLSDSTLQMPMLRQENIGELFTFCNNYFELFFSAVKASPVMVFDNCQKVKEDSIFFKLINIIANHAPDGAQIILISRFSPPQAMARNTLHNNMALLKWDDLLLSPKEIREFASEFQNATISDAYANQIYNKTLGWMAGLTLLLNQSIKNPRDIHIDELKVPELVFEYFTTEAFNHFDKATRTFLLKTAWLPPVNSEMASKITECGEAASIFETLLKRNFFIIQRQHQNQILYQYHPLFKEFLKKKSSEILEPNEISRIKIRAAEYLLAGNKHEEAAHLLQSCREWKRLAQLICDRGDIMIETCRHSTLSRLIDALPQTMVLNNPWLLYWKAASKLPQSPKDCQPLLEKAFSMFAIAKDIHGQLCTAVGVMDAIIYQQTDFHQMDYWLNELNRLTDPLPDFISIELEARIANCILNQFPFRTMLSLNFQKWIKRAQTIWTHVSNVNTRIELVSNILEYLSKKGNYADSALMADALSRHLLKEADPLSNGAIVGNMRIGWFHWHWGDNEQAITYCRKAMTMAHKAGIHVWDCLIWSINAYGALCLYDLATADRLIQKIKDRLAARPPNLDTAHYHYVCAWRYGISGENNRAVNSCIKALEMAENIGALGPAEYCRHGLANALLSDGDIDRARKAIDKALNSAAVRQLEHLHYQCLLTRSYIEIISQKNDTGINYLKTALRLGKKHGLVQSTWWHKDIIQSLYLTALQEQIEVSWVKHLIRKSRLEANKKAMECPHWPWAVKIRTFGNFEILLDDQPVNYPSKQPRKILELLKAIVAYPGDSVPVTWLMDNLWADAEGDKAAESLKVSVRRLRNLLRDSRAIQWRKGHIRINPEIVWVDLKAFELINRKNGTMVSSNPSPKALEKTIQSVCDIVKGPFLEGDDTLPVFINRRAEIELWLLAFLKPLIDIPLPYNCILSIIPVVNNIVNDTAISEKLTARLLALAN